MPQDTTQKQDLEDIAKFFGLEKEISGKLMLTLTHINAKTLNYIRKGKTLKGLAHLATLAEFVREARTYLFEIRSWDDWTSQDAEDMKNWLDNGQIELSDTCCANCNCANESANKHKDKKVYTPLQIFKDRDLTIKAYSQLFAVTE